MTHLFLKLIKPSCEKYKNNVFYNGAITWNNLPANARNIQTYEKIQISAKKMGFKPAVN